METKSVNNYHDIFFDKKNQISNLIEIYLACLERLHYTGFINKKYENMQNKIANDLIKIKDNINNLDKKSNKNLLGKYLQKLKGILVDKYKPLQKGFRNFIGKNLRKIYFPKGEIPLKLFKLIKPISGFEIDQKIKELNKKEKKLRLEKRFNALKLLNLDYVLSLLKNKLNNSKKKNIYLGNKAHIALIKRKGKDDESILQFMIEIEYNFKNIQKLFNKITSNKNKKIKLYRIKFIFKVLAIIIQEFLTDIAELYSLKTDVFSYEIKYGNLLTLNINENELSQFKYSKRINGEKFELLYLNSTIKPKIGGVTKGIGTPPGGTPSGLPAPTGTTEGTTSIINMNLNGRGKFVIDFTKLRDSKKLNEEKNTLKFTIMGNEYELNIENYKFPISKNGMEYIKELTKLNDELDIKYNYENLYKKFLERTIAMIEIKKIVNSGNQDIYLLKYPQEAKSLDETKINNVNFSPQKNYKTFFETYKFLKNLALNNFIKINELQNSLDTFHNTKNQINLDNIKQKLKNIGYLPLMFSDYLGDIALKKKTINFLEKIFIFKIFFKIISDFANTYPATATLTPPLPQINYTFNDDRVKKYHIDYHGDYELFKGITFNKLFKPKVKLDVLKLFKIICNSLIEGFELIIKKIFNVFDETFFVSDTSNIKLSELYSNLQSENDNIDSKFKSNKQIIDLTKKIKNIINPINSKRRTTRNSLYY